MKAMYSDIPRVRNEGCALFNPQAVGMALILLPIVFLLIDGIRNNHDHDQPKNDR